MRKIHFKNIELLKVNKYYFSKSETIEASALYENKKVPVIIKVQRFNKNDITKEIDILTKLNEMDLPFKVPKIYEVGKINNKNYYVCEKIKGDNLNYIIRKNFYYRYNYLFEYGKSLALIHNIPTSNMLEAKERNINIIDDSKINNFKKEEVKADKNVHFEHVKETLELLYKTFPKAFVKDGEVKPLKIGIFDDLKERIASVEGLSITKVRAALRMYTARLKYLYSVKEGVARIDLDGNATSCRSSGAKFGIASALGMLNLA